MRFHALMISCCSACFECENDAAYYAKESYTLLLNGKALGERRENVFSLFDLAPDTDYTLSTLSGDFALPFHTRAQSACLPVRDFGAVGNGVADDTAAIQMAIDACPKDGRVTIAPGVYSIRPILLKSHITLELQKGAALLGSTNEADYPVWPATAGRDAKGAPVVCAAWEGRAVPSHQALLSAQHAEDIYIVGEGLLDGNAQNATWWMDPKKRTVGRPRMLFLNACRDVVMQGVTVQNSPSWNLHPYRCQNVGFYDIRVRAPKDSPNTDGCDPESCDGVSIIGARFSVGDDAIAIKSGKAGAGELVFPRASRHTIRNCLMEFAHGAVVLGSEMSGGIDTLSVSQSLFVDTDRGLRIKTRRGRGKHAVIDGVSFSNIRMRGVRTPLVINMFYCCDADGKSDYVQSKEAQPIDEGTPYLGSFRFTDILCEDCHAAAGYFYGLPEQPIGSVYIENASFRFAPDAQSDCPAMMCDIEPCKKQGLFFENVRDVRLKNVCIQGEEGERVHLGNTDSFTEE
ncbi:MAG: glycoside hydrolase family 28 protein [Clostridia bacterium]|nr:glycoside hydrolase family 28 protein [Clostridia bacterium]